MLIFGLIYLYFYYFLPVLLIFVLIFDKQYLSFIATSAFLICLFFIFTDYHLIYLYLISGAVNISMFKELLHIFYIIIFILYLFNKNFRNKYFSTLFIAISFLNLFLAFYK